MAAPGQKKPKIKDLNLTSDQLKLAKKFASDIGIGTNDELHYYALLWYKNNLKQNGNLFTPTKQKRFDKELERRSKSKQYIGPVIKEVLGKILLSSLQEQTDKDLQSQNAPEATNQVRAATARVSRRTQPARPQRPTITITIDKNEVEKGDSYTVTWKSENANFVSRSTQFNPSLNDVELSGSRTITSNRIGSKTFSITVRNLSGASASARATVNIVAVKETSQSPQQTGRGTTPQTRRPRTTTTRVTRSSMRSSDTQLLNSINKSLKNIVSILENQAGLIRAIEKKRKKDAENERRSKREGILEMAKGVGGLLIEKALTPIKSIFEKIWRFIFFTLLGRAFTEFLNWFNDPKNKDKVKTLSRFLKDNFWLLIGGAALYFLTPLGGFINSLIGKLAWYTTKLIASKVLLNPKFLAISAAIAGLVILSKLYNKLPGQEEAVKSFVERGGKVKEGKGLDLPGVDVMNERYKTPMGGRTSPGFAEGVASGGYITDKTGMRVKGAGSDTQLTALTPGEVVMNTSAVQALGAGNLLALNKMYGGPNANKPKTLGNIFGMSGGGMVGANKLNSDQLMFINKAMSRGIINPKELSAFMSQIHVEQGGVFSKPRKELYNSDPKDPPGKPGYTYFSGYANPELGLGNRNADDAYNYRGRGYLQLTGRSNYENIGKKINVDLLKNPNLLVTNKEISMDAAIEYWKTRVRPNVKNWDDVFNVSRLVNNPSAESSSEVNHFQERNDRYKFYSRLPKSVYSPKLDKNPKSKPKGNKNKQGFRMPNLGSLIPNFSRPAAATNKSSAKPKESQKPWWDLSRFMGKKKGGLITSNMFSINGLTADRYPILAQDGEYVVPRLTVQKLGLQFFNDLVASTDKNSEAAKLSPIPKNEALLPPVSSSFSMSQIMTLPPIMNTSKMSPQSSSSSSSQIPSFPTVSPQSGNNRKYLSDIYGIG